MRWLEPIFEWWDGVQENPKPWWIFGVGLALPFLNLAHMPEPIFWSVIVLGCILCVVAPFFTYGSVARRFYLAALAFVAYDFANAVVYTIGMSDFN